ncbi:MAG: hypothetical protein ACRD5Z_00630, partial [Bryobacteraceae bacterium]
MEIRPDHGAFCRYSSRKFGSFTSFRKLTDLNLAAPIRNDNVSIGRGSFRYKLFQVRNGRSRRNTLDQVVLRLA